GRYAVMALIDLYEISGKNDNSKPVSLLSIAKRQNISLSYLEQIFANLRKNNMVKSIKGPGGGYVLARNAKEIMVSNIILATGENLKMTACNNT
ncbi:Rrf2 family transcriptional regulator, partial [Mycobacterium tuberculosis]|nr:Rrf2 family transcriptional regulator [Mycobacterium tuberculosis]